MFKYIVTRETTAPVFNQNRYEDLRRVIGIFDTEDEARRCIFDAIVGERAALADEFDRHKYIMPELSVHRMSECWYISAYQHRDIPWRKLGYHYNLVWID